MNTAVGEATLNAGAQQALDLLQAGRRDQAEALLQRIIEVQPNHFHALHLLGIVALEKNDADRAVTLLSQAVALNPHAAAAQSNLAAALLAQQRPADALERCSRALTLEPNHARALVNQGQALRGLARPAEALQSFDRALALDARLAEARSGRGNSLFDLGRFDEALATFELALQNQPESKFVLNDLARTLLRLRRPNEALSMLDAALRHDPAFVEALINRGSALRELQSHDAAARCYREALRIGPESAEAHSNLANLLLHLGQAPEALNGCERALELDPRLIEAWDIRAQALRSLGRLQDSVSALRRLLELVPEHPYALGKYINAKAAACDWSQLPELAARVGAGVTAGRRVCTPMIHLALSDSPAAQLRCAHVYAADKLPPRIALAPRFPHRHTRPRIAYVSADFGDHPVAHLLVGVLERHDRKAFEILGIDTSSQRRVGAVHERIVRAVEHFHDVGGRSDRDAAVLLRELEVDIAIDLGGHTRGSRLGIFAYRPAPIQVSFLGFMGTTGTDVIDYVIGDAMALPMRMQAFFSERFVHLPRCFLPNDDGQTIADRTWSRADAGLPDSGLVFCAFNSPYKINATMFDLWVQLLQQVPGSVLWLRDGETAMRENLRTQASSRQLDPARLVFAPVVSSMAEHLARYRLADLFLDTLPFGAHSTARDALWAGLPVLTCLGDALAGRVAASLLHALGMDELIAGDTQEYLSRAISLARSPIELRSLRARLAERRAGSPVFSTTRYCRDLETAFSTMLQSFTDRLAPAPAAG